MCVVLALLNFTVRKPGLALLLFGPLWPSLCIQASPLCMVGLARAALRAPTPNASTMPLCCAHVAWAPDNAVLGGGHKGLPYLKVGQQRRRHGCDTLK